MDTLDLNGLFKSVIDQDVAPAVICDIRLTSLPT